MWKLSGRVLLKAALLVVETNFCHVCTDKRTFLSENKALSWLQAPQGAQALQPNE